MSHNNESLLARLDKWEAEGKEIRKALANQKSLSIFDRVNSYEDALLVYKQEYGAIPAAIDTILSYSGDDPEMIATRDQKRMELIIKVLNEGWESDPNNPNQPKYYPLFRYISSGLGLSYHVVYVGGYSGSSVGSRLHYKDEKTMEHGVKIGISLYASFMIKNKNI
jgi:hypothetical protein